MPQTVDHAAMREMKEVILPSAKPEQIIAPRINDDGIEIPGKIIPGRTVAGTIPMKDIPFMDYPRVVYLHPRKPYKRMFLPVDGHGNKEWQWVANEAQTLVVKDEKEFEAAKKKNYQAKPFIQPEMPLESPDPADVAKVE